MKNQLHSPFFLSMLLLILISSCQLREVPETGIVGKWNLDSFSYHLDSTYNSNSWHVDSSDYSEGKIFFVGEGNGSYFLLGDSLKFTYDWFYQITIHPIQNPDSSIYFDYFQPDDNHLNLWATRYFNSWPINVNEVRKFYFSRQI